VIGHSRITALMKSKKTGEVFMEVDESRGVALGELVSPKEDGPLAEVAIAKKRGMSKEIRNGFWLSCDVHCSVTLYCPQNEDKIIEAAFIAEDLVDEKSFEMLDKAEELIETIAAEERAKLPKYSNA
jgi:hypothetical protein